MIAKRLVQNNIVIGRIRENTIWMLIAYGGRAFFQSTFIILLAKLLGPIEFGNLSSLLAMFSILFPFVGFGFGNVLIMQVSRDYRSFSMSWGSSIISTFISFIFFISFAIFVGEKIFSQPFIVIFILGLSELLFGKIIELAGQCFQAFERLKITSLIYLLVSFLRFLTLLFVMVISSNITIIDWIWWYLCVNLMASIICYIAVNKKLGVPRLSLENIIQHLKLGFNFSIGISSKTVYTDIDKIMLANLYNAEAAGIYTVAYKIIGFSYMPVQAILAATYSRFFQYGEKGIKNSLNFGLKILKITVSYGIVLSIVLYLLSPLMTHFLGKQYIASVNVVKLLVLVPLIQSIYYPLADILTGSGYQSLRTKFQVVAMIINVLLNVFWIPLYSWKGAAFATIISECFILLSIVIFIALKNSKEKEKELLLHIEN